ncbi:endonuclease domain-containing protein [Micromonospora sp. LA-10]|uniref:endonuclease domain-containing protein n=1 Tax=Micromonospora sp. LA-10 TaxID=3446364 RepID=UPI003F714CF6
MFKALDDESVRAGAEQISVADVLKMIARDGVTPITAKRCRACKPPLPTLDPSSFLVQPVCWSWAASAPALQQARANATDRSSAETNVLPEQRVAYALLKHWHAGRCAVCGETPVRGGLVRDHDHSSGLMRGLLCSSCNTAEGRSNSLLFENYRRRPPAAILNVEVLYLPLGFRPGSRHQTPSAM